MSRTWLPTPGLRIACGLVVLLLLMVLGFFTWQAYYPVQAASGWHYRVVHDDVAKAASMAPAENGALLVSRELRDGQGSILRIQADGTRTSVVEGLSKPDGIVATRGGWVFSQEVAGAKVGFLKDGQVSTLFQGANVQGLWDDGDELYAVEDHKAQGRILRYRWRDGALDVVRTGLHEPESITRCTDGRLLYTEKGMGVVRELTADGSDPAVLVGLNQPTFVMCDGRGLWVTEDSTHRARLLLIDTQGRQRTVLSMLKAPQAIIAQGDGTYLVAEGGRDRVLELKPQER